MPVVTYNKHTESPSQKSHGEMLYGKMVSFFLSTI